MTPTNRRGFLSDVGRGMLAAGLGTALASDLGSSAAFADQGSDAIPLGEYAALVELMRSTPAEKLQPLLAGMILKWSRDEPEKADRSRRSGQCRGVWRLRLRRLPYGHGHASGLGNEPSVAGQPAGAARAESAVPQRAADPERRWRLSRETACVAPGRACCREFVGRRLGSVQIRVMPAAENRTSIAAKLCWLRSAISARRIQCPAAGHAGRSQRASLRVCPSHLRAGRSAGQRIRLLAAKAMRAVVCRSRTEPH